MPGACPTRSKPPHIASLWLVNLVSVNLGSLPTAAYTHITSSSAGPPTNDSHFSVLVDPTCPSDITTASATIVNPGYPDAVSTDTGADSCSSSASSRTPQAPRIFFPTTSTTTTATSTSVTNVESTTAADGTAQTTYRWAIYKATDTVSLFSFPKFE